MRTVSLLPIFDMKINHEEEFNFNDDDFLYYHEGTPSYKLERNKFEKLQSKYQFRIVLFTFIHLNSKLSIDESVSYLMQIVESHFTINIQPQEIRETVIEVKKGLLNLETELPLRYVLFNPRSKFMYLEKQAITAHLVHKSHVTNDDIDDAIEWLMGEQKKITHETLAFELSISRRSIGNMLSNEQKVIIHEFNTSLKLFIQTDKYFETVESLKERGIKVVRKTLMKESKLSGKDISKVIREVKKRQKTV